MGNEYSLASRMYCLQPLYQLEQALPEFDDVPSTTWRRFPFEIFLQGPFVGKLQEDVVIISMDIATIELYDAIRLPHTSESADLLVVTRLAILGWIPLEQECICVRIVRLL